MVLEQEFFFCLGQSVGFGEGSHRLPEIPWVALGLPLLFFAEVIEIVAELALWPTGCAVVAASWFQFDLLEDVGDRGELFVGEQVGHRLAPRFFHHAGTCGPDTLIDFNDFELK